MRLGLDTTISSGAPRVSVCIPTIDRPHLLREALASVAAQTFPDFEVVVADNSGQPEDQRAIDRVLAEFGALPLRLVRHPSQIGPAENFNSLIDAARGEFWACLPDDDRLCPTFLARTVAALETHPTCSFAFSDHWILRADGTIDERQSQINSAHFGRTSLREGEFRSDDLFGVVLAQSPCLQATLFRRSVMESARFTADLFTVDLSLFLRLGAAPGVGAFYIGERLMEYRVHGQQITVTTSRIELVRAAIAALETIDRVPSAHRRPFRRKLSREYLALALLEAESGATDQARRHALDSLRLSATPRTALGAALAILAPGALPLARRLAANVRGSAARSA
jgi:glycosyltransferase involved in cell wall biosynthesis